MKFTMVKQNYESGTSTRFAKENLLAVCKWFNFIEDDMHVRFPDNHITVVISLDYFIAGVDNYTKNGVIIGDCRFSGHQRLTSRQNFDCYCLFGPNKIPVQFIYVNKSADVFNGFEFGVQLNEDLDLVEIDTRIYDGC